MLNIHKSLNSWSELHSFMKWIAFWLFLCYLGENHDLSQVTDKVYHIMWYTSPWSRFKLTTSVVISTDSKGSWKSKYHTIMATTPPKYHKNNQNAIHFMKLCSSDQLFKLLCIFNINYLIHVSRSGRGVPHYVINFVSDLWQVMVFSGYSCFLHRYNWNIVESDFKHHQTNKQTSNI
jgi:hypothetical protein